MLGLPDVKALSPAADAIVFVVQWDRTRRDAAAAALKQLADVSAQVSGVVLTQVDMKKHASYAYGDAAQYYLKYSKCYSQGIVIRGDEEAPMVAKYRKIITWLLKQRV